MTQIHPSKPVTVTGATGYVAGVLVQKLLQQGLSVHATVRDIQDEAKLKHLKDQAAICPGTLTFFQADLLEEGAFLAAMQGCDLVFHTASPFINSVKDAEKELLKPAVVGTANVLKSATQAGGVKRVVLTSSCAAIYGDCADLASTRQGVFTESDWNTSSSADYNPYFYSKLLAEKEAWRIEGMQSAWDLVVLNPSLVMGPGLMAHTHSESFAMIKRFGNGDLKMGCPRFGLGVVDVRDVAEAHYQAAFTAKASGRYIISGHNTDLLAMAKTLLPTYGRNYPIPTRALPKALVWLLGPWLDKDLTRQFVAKNVNLPWRADNTKSRQELGIQYRPLSVTLNDFFAQLIESGQLD